MKKRFLVLAMIACILGLTACGKADNAGFITEEMAIQTAEGICDDLNAIVTSGQAAQYAQSSEMLAAAFESYEGAAAEFGNYVGVVAGETVATVGADKADIKVTIQGDKIYKEGKMRQAVVEIVMTPEGFDSITTNVKYDMSELMVKAALNTLLGMGTVFAVLILISLVIGAFGYIPKIQGMFAKKTKEDAKAAAVDNTIAQIAEKEEAAGDDLELIAVITAAIAASEGQTSTDGYVVRSIIRR